MQEGRICFERIILCRTSKGTKKINEILKSDDYDEIIRITELLEDCSDLIQTIAIVLERSTFLDAYIKIGDYADKTSIGEISDIFQIYINDVEIAKLNCDDEISDDKLLKRFTAKCIEKKEILLRCFQCCLL